MSLSIVTVCMNRRQHLLATATQVAAWPHHGEHLIVDWSSREPLRRQELPADPRLRLLRVEGEERWNLCRAYNFAMATAQGTVLLKLDADAWPEACFDPGAEALSLNLAATGQEGRLPCAFGSGGGGRRGQLLIARRLFEAVGGFHEMLEGYGFDDKDLSARLAQVLGLEPARIPSHWFGVLPHSDASRGGAQGTGGALVASYGLAALRASRLANRLQAAHTPWNANRPRSAYRRLGPELWRVDPATLPVAAVEISEEIDHARRMTFWGCFLAIPEIFLEELPVKLVPPPLGDQWPVRWWHRLWWRSGRRLIQLPVTLLSLSRGQLEALRAAIRLGRRR
jgi:hypothetical protein